MRMMPEAFAAFIVAKCKTWSNSSPTKRTLEEGMLRMERLEIAYKRVGGDEAPGMRVGRLAERACCSMIEASSAERSACPWEMEWARSGGRSSDLSSRGSWASMAEKTLACPRSSAA